MVGLDLSPTMIEIARRDHPGPRYEVGSMTSLKHGDCSAAGALLFWSLIHIPDDSVGIVLAEVFRVVRPGGVAMIGFHVGDRVNRKTEGYGGLAMQVNVHLRPVAAVADALRQAGFMIEATLLLNPDDQTPGGVVVARRPLSRTPANRAAPVKACAGQRSSIGAPCPGSVHPNTDRSERPVCCYGVCSPGSAGRMCGAVDPGQELGSGIGPRLGGCAGGRWRRCTPFMRASLRRQ